ncbi:hypothetical protein [Foetidibacter luteolus]|uniref:hypothetical protein n=1 Tax=Foetidibacter luteolus TaxID=2608880 RepID=UPI00129B9261|nr:hypothetical protein [Foetidibacter luteolus]
MIERLLYDLGESQLEIFHFAEMTTLEVTGLLNDKIKINSAKIVTYHKNDYLGEDVIDNFKTIEEFNRFFIDNRKYYLHDCDFAWKTI